jgi:integrase
VTQFEISAHVLTAGCPLHTQTMWPLQAARFKLSHYLDRGEFEAVMVHLADPDLRDFCRWFYWTGLRPGEIRSLSWEDFDRETWTLRLHARNAKTGFGRALALEGELRAIIDNSLCARRLDCSLMFHRSGRPVGDFRKSWKRACREAGLEGK